MEWGGGGSFRVYIYYVYSRIEGEGGDEWNGVSGRDWF